ncbi:hypothetical protein JHD48_07610 [Sulfurimonas sp. SAG-AH-194-I05]|nr:hypothetical protein [Sulfurimonas sp. SAG-AH-194-I05]MDF1875598.1 hypothetical protein [Sulfurimonas sp. SAG-AH-194-I05]
MFLFLTFCTIFIVLQNGLYIENISLPNFQAKQLYIKWNESLDISIKEIKIKEKTDISSTFEVNSIFNYLSQIANFYNLIEKISIKKLSYNDITASLKYVRNANGSFYINTPDLSIKAKLLYDHTNLIIKITHMQDKNRNIKLDGNIFLSTIDNSITSSFFYKY